MRASESLISNKEKRRLFDSACKPIEKEHCVKKAVMLGGQQEKVTCL